MNRYCKTPGAVGLKRGLLFLFLFVLNKDLPAQRLSEFDMANRYYQVSDQRYNFRFTLSFHVIIQGGWGFSLAAGSWVDMNGWQPALNNSANVFFRGNNLGNARFYGDQNNKKVNPNKLLVNLVFSPMLTYGISDAKSYYDEINPFYYGSSTIVYNNYRHAVTAGMSFVTMPRGTYNNIATARNRTQQLLYVQLKSGDWQLNLYEDFLLFTSFSLFEWLCDNRDRYYTGGGNLQYRISPFMKIKLYSEMYTGNSFVDKQDYPDHAYPGETPDLQRKGRNINKKYAYQDPGQQSFNKARNFLCLDINSVFLQGYNDLLYNNSIKLNNHTQVILGRQGGSMNMLQQNFIHNVNPVDRDNKDRTRASSLHHFDYRDNFFPKLIFGIGNATSY